HIGNFVPRDLFWRDERIGWAAGYDYSGIEVPWPRLGRSALYRTEDGGSTWSREFGDDGEPFFDKVKFINDQNGWLVAREKVYRTTDGGRNWTACWSFSSGST